MTEIIQPKLLREDEELMRKQLDLISMISPLLEELYETTQLDSPYSRGFGSFYPCKAINMLKTMKFAIQLELCENQ